MGNSTTKPTPSNLLSQPPPPASTRINLDDLLANPQRHKEMVFRCMSQNGFLTVKLDPDTRVSIDLLIIY